MDTRKILGLVSLLAILVLAVLGAGYLKSKVNSGQVAGDNTQNGQGEGMLSGKQEGTQVYESKEKGVRFTYNPRPAEGVMIKISETPTKIFVHQESQQPEQGQSIEVFAKDPNISVEDAIRQQFLQDRNPAECYPRTYEGTEQDKPNYVAAGISYPAPTDPNQPFWQNRDKCPADYSETNAVQYFLMNRDVPGKLLFVKIGQDSITSDGTPVTAEGGYNWSHSIEIF